MRIPKSKRKLKQTELVEDNGFENNSTDWVWGGDGVHDRSTDYPHTDNYSARTGWPDGGQTADAHDYVYQEISIPDSASCVKFSFWRSIRSDDYCNYDFASVYIKDTGNNVLETVLDFCCDGSACTTLYEEVTYNLSGRVVRKLVNESQSPGRYTTHWDGKDEYGNQVSGGAYFCRLKVGTKLLIRTLICIK